MQLRNWPATLVIRRCGAILALCLAANHVLAATAPAQAPSLDFGALVAPEPTASGGESAEDRADIDDLLKLDMKDLAQAPVLKATMTDPVVEGISKTAEKSSEAPGIVEVISAEDIRAYGAKNLYEVLERGTSVFMTGSFLFRRNVTSIRGVLENHSDNHVLFLINGRPFRDVTGGGYNLSLLTAFPIETIERIEIIRGPGSVLYGTNAFSGVINVVTKNPNEPTVHASLLGGSHGWQSYSAALGNGNETEGAYVGANYSRQKGWPFTATSEDPPGPNPATTATSPYGEDNFGAFLMYRNRDFTANLFVANASEEQIGPDGQFPTESLGSPRLFFDLGYLRQLDECRSLAVNFTYNYDGTNFPVPSSTPEPQILNHTLSHSFLVEGTYRTKLTQNLSFMVGSLVDFHVGQGGRAPNYATPPYDEIWYAVYAQFDYKANDWLKLIGGMQANMPGEIESGIVPRAGAIVSLSENWTAKFLYGQAFRSPYQSERSVNVPGFLIGSPDLKPETIQTFDVQLAYHTEDFRFAATYFHSDYFDIVTRTSGLPQSYISQGSMDFQGVELENKWQLTDRLRWLGAVTYQENIRDGVHDTTSVPNWMAKMGLAYVDECNGLTVGLFDAYFSDGNVPATAALVNPPPTAHHLVSLNATLDLNRYFSWNPCTRTTAQFLIQNLLDEEIHHVEFEREAINTLPGGPGRTFYGGVAIDY